MPWKYLYATMECYASVCVCVCVCMCLSVLVQICCSCCAKSTGTEVGMFDKQSMRKHNGTMHDFHCLEYSYTESLYSDEQTDSKHVCQLMHGLLNM